MGLQTNNNAGSGKVTFLSVAGGYVWDKSVEEGHPDYKTQEYAKLEGEVGVRSGARYDALAGSVTGVEFQDHEQYGESIRVSIDSGGEAFIISIGTNNRYSQDMMKVLLKMDFTKELLISPYDFTDKKKNKRVQGISFKQSGNKIPLRNDDAPFEKEDFFKTATQKKKKRFFEDLTEWFVNEVKKLVEETSFPSSGVLEDKAPETKTPVAAKKVAPKKVQEIEVVEEEVPSDELEGQLDALLG
jgi:hypothetical protein